MKRNEILEGFGRRDAYQRDYDSSVSGMGRGHDHRGLGQELAHERNNYAVAINGKTWKVFADKRQAQNVAAAVERKTGKKCSVHETGADPTVDEVLSTGVKQPGKVQKVNPDGTADVVDAKGTVTKVDQKAIAPDANDPNKLMVNVPKPKLQPGTDVSMVTPTTESINSLKKLAGL